MAQETKSSEQDDQEYQKLFTNNPYCQEINVNGEPVMMINAIGMMMEQQRFYEKVQEENYLWFTDYFGYFIDDDRKICGNVEAIRKIKNDDLLQNEWKEKNLRIVNVGASSTYKKYQEIMLLANNKDKRLNEIPCIKMMMILKDIGNAVKVAGKLDKAAMLIYCAAIGGVQGDQKHTLCRHNKKKKDVKNHDDILSKLYHNISLLYFENNNLDLSAEYAKRALELNPNYKKCLARLNFINKK